MATFIWRLFAVISAGVLAGFGSYKFFFKLERLELAVLGATEGGGLWISVFLGILVSVAVAVWIEYQQSCRIADLYSRRNQS